MPKDNPRTAASRVDTASSELSSLPGALGIHLRGEDMVYALMTFFEVANDPDAMASKAPLYRALIDRILPDTDFTRKRAARALQGFEELSRAARVLLTLEDLDLLGEMKNLLVVGLKEMEAAPKPGGKSPAEIANKHFEVGIEELLERLRNYPDPRVRNSLTVLSRMGQILDLSKPMPSLPSSESISLASLSLRTRHRRRPRAKRTKR